MNNAQEDKDKQSAMENSDFKGRIDKVFGSIFQLSSSSDGGWRLSDEQVPKKQWKRDESASAREDMPCGSSFDGFMDMGVPRGRTNKKSQWEGDYDDSDDERKAEDGSSGGNKAEEDEVEDEARGMRFVVGMDSTLDQEDEEDEFDKVAVGREDAGERTYMKEIMDTGPKINSHNALPSSLNEWKSTGRDPRANHYAARARLEEDDEEAAAAHPDSEMVDKLNLGNKEECTKLNDGKENNELMHSNNGSEMENVTVSLPMEEIKPKTCLKSIIKGKKRQTEVQQDMEKESSPLEEAVSGLGTCCPMDDSSTEKPKKRVRFDPGINGDPAGQLEKKHDLIKVVNSRKRSFVRGVGSSSSLQIGYNRVPDYIRNPSKYIHYTLDWSNEDDEMINMQAFNEFSQLVKPSASAQLGDSAELPKSVTFIPRKRALSSNKTKEDSNTRNNNQSTVEGSNENSNQPVIFPLGIAAGQSTETESPTLGNDEGESEKIDTINKNSRLNKGTRQYRSKTDSDEETEV
ncbi:hypothetical protein SUGI_0939510 [Cryptomeria japonica]|uniref:uncharacterized protein LOC131075947 n=1 Tax=Cryptomeria japonica TaxID=3369 RepID=UPI002414858A|nr:uncharacterized protein LOC131075947 [Cryptomeria japonica]GLJ44687.1 hypothetical protein SUGI_0939510 [Cryptomeria japonica]